MGCQPISSAQIETRLHVWLLAVCREQVKVVRKPFCHGPVDVGRLPADRQSTDPPFFSSSLSVPPHSL